jgi:hypothetical protein
MAVSFQSQKHPLRKPLTQERLKELFTYNPDTGEFFYKTSRGSNAVGNKAGTMSNGYLVIRIDYILYRAHRLAWLYVHGAFPQNEIDHINLDRTDNRICNLRTATRLENCGNQPSRSECGLKGVTYCRDHGRRKRWQAQITVNYKPINLGRFHTKEEAHAAYCTAAQKIFGNFARTE